MSAKLRTKVSISVVANPKDSGLRKQHLRGLEHHFGHVGHCTEAGVGYADQGETGVFLLIHHPGCHVVRQLIAARPRKHLPYDAQRDPYQPTLAVACLPVTKEAAIVFTSLDGC